MNARATGIIIDTANATFFDLIKRILLLQIRDKSKKPTQKRGSSDSRIVLVCTLGSPLNQQSACPRWGLIAPRLTSMNPVQFCPKGVLGRCGGHTHKGNICTTDAIQSLSGPNGINQLMKKGLRGFPVRLSANQPTDKWIKMVQNADFGILVAFIALSANVRMTLVAT